MRLRISIISDTDIFHQDLIKNIKEILDTATGARSPSYNMVITESAETFCLCYPTLYVVCG
jgi:hypothetical protein